MATIKTVDFERSRVGKGMKSLALALVLAASAVAADHIFFVAPNARSVAAPVAHAAPAATIEKDGFALPAHLRATPADVEASAPTF